MSANFEDLKVWKKSSDLVVELYNDLKNTREFSIKDQMIRAALSIPSNIAEGSERNSDIDFKRFLNYAKGSAAELRTQIYIAEKIKILSMDRSKYLINKLIEISKMLEGLYKALTK